MGALNDFFSGAMLGQKQRKPSQIDESLLQICATPATISPIWLTLC